MKVKRFSLTLTEKNGNVPSFRHVQSSEIFNQTHGFFIVSHNNILINERTGNLAASINQATTPIVLKAIGTCPLLGLGLPRTGNGKVAL